MENPVVRRTARSLPPYLTCTIGGKKIATKEKRWYKDVGLGFKTPPEAINGTYIGVFNSCIISVLIVTWNFR